MKDRNGKTLRVGDVCVVNSECEIAPFPCPVGEVVCIIQLRESFVVCYSCYGRRLLFPDELEIIGDVR